MKQVSNTNKTNALLKELKNIYGIGDKCKDNIKSYCEYLKLRKSGNINIGNYNIMIKCKSDFTQIEKLVQLLEKLLIQNGIISSSCLYIEERQLRNSYRIKESKDTQLLIVDSDIVNLSEINLKECIESCKNSIFIVIDKERFYWGSEPCFNNIYWTFELEDVSDKDKTRYIKQILKQNDIKVDSNCNLISIMSNMEYEKVQQELMNIIITCKSRNIDKINNKFLVDINKREYLKQKISNTKVSNSKKAGLQELNALEGLEEVKKQIQYILNYIKVNKDRGTIPSLHMCFYGNPRSWKNKCSKSYWKDICRGKSII